MDALDVHGRLLPSPFVSSFVARARPGDLTDTDPSRRAAAWANWLISSITEMTGIADRTYAALVLPGRFYDPKGKGPTVRPHLEIAAHVLSKPDPDMPDRLALMGNGLTFEWWLLSEVVALRRALFNTPQGSVAHLVELLNTRRVSLVDGLIALMRTAGSQWSVIENLLVTSPDGLSAEATGDFSTAEISEFFPPAADYNLQIVFDAKLREVNGQWASRRVGVWQMTGTEDGHAFALGVVTPRLTANSLFNDPRFDPMREGAGALLVRALLLRRIIRTHLGVQLPDGVITPDRVDKATSGPRLRAIPARVGHKIPEASLESAVHFLQCYPDAHTAWEILKAWAGTRAVLTVTEDGFIAAHRNALRFLRRAEDPERDDVNVVLPLAWDEKAQVVRVTFSRPSPEQASE